MATKLKPTTEADLPNLKYGDTFVNQDGTTGIVKFDYKTGKALPIPTVQSSDMARTAATEAQNKLTNIQNTTSNNTSTLPPAPVSPPSVVLNEAPKSELQTKLDMITSSAEAEVKSMTSMFDNMSATLDANTNSLIAGIKNTFASRINQMKEINRAAEAGTETAGFVSGRARYAPEIQTAILSNVEREGVNRIMDLEAQEKQLIAEAQSASDGKKMELLFKKMNTLSDVHSSKMSAIADLNKEMIEMEKFNLQVAAEKRQQMKDDIANGATIAKNLASSLEASFTGDAEYDNALVMEAAQSYGIDPNFINQAIADSRAETQKALPSELREYDELVNRGQYKGTFLQYQKAKTAANRVASTPAGTKGLTTDDVNRYDLPKELIGKTPKGIIEDLSVSRIPEWFKVSQARAGHSADQANWDIFRNSGDMEVFKKTLDINKVDSSSSAFNWAALGGIPATIQPSEE